MCATATESGGITTTAGAAGHATMQSTMAATTPRSGAAHGHAPMVVPALVVAQALVVVPALVLALALAALTAVMARLVAPTPPPPVQRVRPGHRQDCHGRVAATHPTPPNPPTPGQALVQCLEAARRLQRGAARAVVPPW